MKNFFKKAWTFMTDSRHEKYFVIGLPCAAVLTAALILTPAIKNLAGNELAEPEVQEEVITITAPSEAPESPAVPSSMPSEKPENGEKEESTNENGVMKTGDKPGTAPAAPSAPGQGTMPSPTPSPRPSAKPSPAPGAKPSPKPGAKPENAPNYEGSYSGGAVEHTEIKNIEAVIEIVDDTELSAYEQSFPGLPEAPIESEAEIIVTPPEAAGTGNVIVEESPVLDSAGNQTYKYTFNLGPSGNLIYTASGAESEYYPVDEDGDGVYDFAETFFVPSTPEEGTESGLTANGYYKTELLYNSDNTPVSLFDIDAEPIVDEVSRKVGWQKYDGRMYYYDTEGDMVKGLKKIDGELCYFDQNGVKAEKLGIDVSFYNGDINWQAVKAQGIDYAIIRVGGRGWESGLVYNDTMFEENIREAYNAGLDVGVYFFSTAVNEREAVEEASYALQKTKGFDLDLPIYIDMEFSNDRPNGRADNLMPYERTAIINAFCETVSNSGRQPGVYSGQNFYRDFMELGKINHYNTWLASYTYNNRLPDFRGRYDMWQFTDRGEINGIDGYVDMNVMFS